MNIYNLITEDEKDFMRSYIYNFGDYAFPKEQIDLESGLRNWASNKKFLFELLGNSLFAEKEIEISKSEEAMVEEVSADKELIRAYDEAYTYLYNNYVNIYSFDSYCIKKSIDITKLSYNFDNVDSFSFLYWDKLYRSSEEYNIYRSNLSFLRKVFTYSNFINNRYSDSEKITFYYVKDNQIKEYVVTKDTKIFRIFTRLSEICPEVKDSLNCISSRTSIYTTNKLVKSNLVLSIHPIDYMTMSDNSYNWSSCMSWVDNGCYRTGTVEMMNNDCVLVAYVEGSNSFDIAGHTWSGNKRWRELFVITPEYMTNIKGYPYFWEEMDNQVFDFLKELAKKNLNIDFKLFSNDMFNESKFIECIRVKMNYMYNDFDTVHTKHKLYISDEHNFIEKNVNRNNTFVIKASAPIICPACGNKIEVDDDSNLVLCHNCRNEHRYKCDDCGGYYNEDELYYIEYEGRTVCQDCLDEYYVYSELLNDYIQSDVAYEIYDNEDKENFLDYTDFDGQGHKEYIGNYVVITYNDEKYYKRNDPLSNYFFKEPPIDVRVITEVLKQPFGNFYIKRRITMRFSVNFRQPAEIINQADEIKVPYKDRNSILDLVQLYPDKDITILCFDENELNWNELKKFNKIAKERLYLAIGRNSLLKHCLEYKEIKFYSLNPVSSFKDLNSLISMGVSYVFLDNELFFSQDKVKSIVNGKAKIRAVANLANHTILPTTNNIIGAWIRPEDVKIYENYIDTIEFYSNNLKQEKAYLNIYKNLQEWPGEISKIILDLNSPNTLNRLIPPNFAEARLNCGQKCMSGSHCKLCKNIINLANPTLIEKIKNI